MADGDDFRPHEDEGDFRQGGGFRIHAAENRGGHEARSVLRVQTAGGLNLPHFVIGRHFQPAEAFHKLDFRRFRGKEVNPEDGIQVLFRRIHLGGALNAFRSLTIEPDHAVDFGGGMERCRA